MDVERGMYVNTPFFIVSRMWMNRVMSVHSNWAIQIKSRKDPKADSNRQVWVWDITSKTIKSVYKKEYSMDTSSTSVYARATTSRWYQHFKYDKGWVVEEKG
jgi:hypothetical protein